MRFVLSVLDHGTHVDDHVLVDPRRATRARDTNQVVATAKGELSRLIGCGRGRLRSDARVGERLSYRRCRLLYLGILHESGAVRCDRPELANLVVVCRQIAGHIVCQIVCCVNIGISYLVRTDHITVY